MAAEFTVTGQCLSYDRLGDGEPLLFLGNLASPASAMSDFAPILNAAGFQLVPVEYHGPADVTVETIAEHVGTLLDLLDLRPWIWGYSQGAFIAQELALLRSDRVRGAVLLATRGRRTRFFDLFLAASHDLEAGAGSDSLAAAFGILATTPPEHLDDDHHVDYLARRIVQARQVTDPERTSCSLRTSARYGDRLAALKAISVPCLVVAFEHDLICTPQLGREVADTIPAAEYTQIPEAGHGGLLSHPVQTLGVVTDFLTRQRTIGRSDE
jgi:pimeloyl-ACP methyl ester carboxylesterase